MLGVGLFLIAMGVSMEVVARLPSVRPDHSEHERLRREAARQLANVFIVAAVVAGAPLVIGGLVDLAAPTWTAVVAAALAVPIGVVAIRAIWARNPVFRRNPGFWDEGARVGGGDRRRSILIISLVLAFTVLVTGLALLAKAFDPTGSSTP